MRGRLIILVLAALFQSSLYANPDAELLYYVSMSHTAAVERLIGQGASVKTVEVRTGRGPIHFAAINGNPRILRLLLANGADPNARDGEGRTPLHLAALHGHAPIVRMLLEEWGAFADLVDNQRNTALHLFARGGHNNVEIADHLITYDRVVPGHIINVDAQDQIGETALIIAARLNLLTLVEFLLERGRADANAQRVNGDTALHVVARAHESCGLLQPRRLAVVHALLRNNADVMRANRAGESPLQAVLHRDPNCPIRLALDNALRQRHRELRPAPNLLQPPLISF